jgi:hypothetical protein
MIDVKFKKKSDIEIILIQSDYINVLKKELDFKNELCQT